MFFWNSLAFSMIQKHSSCDRPRSQEELPHAQGQGSTKSARLRRRRNGQKELSHVRGQGRRPRRATPPAKVGAVAERSNSTSKEQRLHGCRRVERSYSTFKVRMGNLLQGKEQQLRFAGAAV